MSVEYRELWVGLFKSLREGDEKIYAQIGLPEDVGVKIDLDKKAHRYLAQFVALKLQRDYHLRKRRKFVKKKSSRRLANGVEGEGAPGQPIDKENNNGD